MEELWKPIPGYEGLYAASTQGKIKSLARYRKGKKGSLVPCPEKIMKPRIKKSGYLQVSLYKNGIAKTFTVHRLVALSFIPNPNDLPFINHKDENKANNFVDNLEWCSELYNTVYGTARVRARQTYMAKPKDHSKAILASAKARSKPIVSITISNGEINEYPSCNYAAKLLGYQQASINRCCLKKQKQSYGRYWYFKELPSGTTRPV